MTQLNALPTEPLLDESGQDCPPGFAYLDVSNEIQLPAGDYDVIVVDGEEDCAATPIAQTTLTLDVDHVQTMVLLGSDRSAAKLAVLAESPPEVNTLGRPREDFLPVLPAGVAGEHGYALGGGSVR